MSDARTRSGVHFSGAIEPGRGASAHRGEHQRDAFDLERGDATEVWARSAERFAAQVAGPHFEELCREYLYGSGRHLRGPVYGTVGSGVVTDPKQRTQVQIDVAAVASGTGGAKRSVAFLAEAKWGTVMGLPHLERLIHARDVLSQRGRDTSGCVLACFSGIGFSDALRERADDGDVRLIGVDDLYA